MLTVKRLSVYTIVWRMCLKSSSMEKMTAERNQMTLIPVMRIATREREPGTKGWLYRRRADVRVEGTHDICAVKCYDNRAVTLVSSLPRSRQHPEQSTMEQSHRSLSSWRSTLAHGKRGSPWVHYSHVQAPHEIPQLVNEHLQMTIILTVNNAWLLYKQDWTSLRVSRTEMLNVRDIQAHVASTLIPMKTTLHTPNKGPSFIRQRESKGLCKQWRQSGGH